MSVAHIGFDNQDNKNSYIGKDKLLADLLTAYYCARRHKRNTYNQLKFELKFESYLLELCEQILSRTYKPLPEIAFIVNKPVKREIFAADFRDRVIHHLLFNYINPVLDKYLIDDCYSCREGRGTSYGIVRAQKFMRACSENYTKDCYVLKCDIKGYFMSIDKNRLYKVVLGLLQKERQKRGFLDFDLNLVNYLLKVIIFNDPTKNCVIKGTKKDWEGLPKSKSLFYAKPDCGLPIGNLTSQLFGNVYLLGFDNFVKRDLGFKYYGRYVDDFILFHQSPEVLKSSINTLRCFLVLIAV